MRPADREHLTELLMLAERGALTRSDVIALFMYVRGDAPNGSMLKDIGHTIAHDERDRGFAFDYVNRFVDHLVAVLSRGGVLKVGVLFKVEELLAELGEMAETLGIGCDHAALLAQADSLVALLADVLDGTRVRLRHENASVWFTGSPEPAFVLSFEKGLQGSAVPLPPLVKLSFPLLRNY